VLVTVFPWMTAFWTASTRMPPIPATPVTVLFRIRFPVLPATEIPACVIVPAPLSDVPPLVIVKPTMST
jgi:hypothetical protein